MNTCYGIDKLLEDGNTRIYGVTQHELSENKVFKAFRSKDIATVALKYQKKLAKYNLAPKVYTTLFHINNPAKKFQLLFTFLRRKIIVLTSFYLCNLEGCPLIG